MLLLEDFGAIRSIHKHGKSLTTKNNHFIKYYMDFEVLNQGAMK